MATSPTRTTAPRLRRPPGAAHRGFTLIELLITLVVAAILVMMAMPNLRDLVLRNRMAANTNELMAAFQYARSEAIRANREAGVCSSSDGATCSGTWGDGWIVWVDTNESGGPNAADEILRAGQASPDVTISAGPAGNRVSFTGRGLRASGDDTPLILQHENCAAGNMQGRRTITFNATGQARVTTGACA